MNTKKFQCFLILVACIFTVVFCWLIIPPIVKNPDIIGAFAAGFVNPYASGYSFDVICCWMVLMIWIIYESPKIRYGWICLVLGLIPGVAVGFAMYLWMRERQREAN